MKTCDQPDEYFTAKQSYLIIAGKKNVTVLTLECYYLK